MGFEFTKHDRLPILTKANSRQWFNQAKTTLEAKDIEYVLTITREVYAFVGPNLPPDPAQLREFKKDDTNARLILLQGLDDFDQEDVKEMTNVKTIWEHLQSKYKDKRPSTSLAILRDLTNYTFTEDQKISEAWNNIKNKKRHLKEINSDVAKAFSETQCFQILLNSLPEAYTSLADSLMTSDATADEKIQKLMDKEDTLTNSGATAMAAYRKSFKASCFLCHGTHLVAQCPQLSKAQAYVEKELARARSKSRSKSRGRKNRRHYQRHGSSSDSDSFTSSEESSDSEDNKKKKKKKNVTFKSYLKKPDKEKKKKVKSHAHTALSDDTSDSSDSQFAAYGAISQSDSDLGSDVEERKAIAYIAAAEEEFPAIRDLLTKTRAETKARRGHSGGAQLSPLWDFDPKTRLLRGTQSGGVSEQGESLD